MRRVAGVNVLNDQGEGRFVAVRGLSPDLNAASINGARVPAPEADVRSVALDVIPAELIESIEIKKSLTPDMDADTIPLEAGIEDRAISHTKGCYVGQEIIIRVLHRGGGRVARKLVGLLVDDAVPSPGDGLRAGDREIGRVTSAVLSPALGRPVALGYVHRDFTTPGTDVQVLRQGTVLNATVAELPFVRRHPGSASPA